jgi:hypothetical protein
MRSDKTTSDHDSDDIFENRWSGFSSYEPSQSTSSIKSDAKSVLSAIEEGSKESSDDNELLENLKDQKEEEEEEKKLGIWVSGGKSQQLPVLYWE